MEAKVFPNNIGTTGNDNMLGTENRDVIRGQIGIDDIKGLGGDDDIFGGPDADDLFGNEGRDNLYGNGGGDQLKGGEGNDILVGGSGKDLLYGQAGFNDLQGEGGNDKLYALGEVNRDADGDAILDEPPDGIDTLTGGSGADTFILQKATDDEGSLFLKSQKFAQITDFDPTGEGDVIRLPGSSDDYVTELYGPDNTGTAILYTEDPDIDISLGLGGIVSISPDIALDVPSQTALVAVLDNVTARDLDNPNFYEYTGV